MAYACQLLGKECIIVMPHNSAQVKVDAVRAYGATADLVDVKIKSRATRVSELAALYPDAYIASAYDDPLVIGALNDRFLAGPENVGGYTPGMWVYTGLSSLGLFFAWKLWRAETGVGAHGLETITARRGPEG